MTFLRYAAALILLAPSISLAASCVDLSRTLSLNTKGSDVSKLQVFLRDNAGYTGQVTGHYGPLTQAAVQKWQRERGIVSSGTPSTTGYGQVGPKTRAAMSCRSPSTTQPSPQATAGTLEFLKAEVARLTAILTSLLAARGLPPATQLPAQPPTRAGGTGSGGGIPPPAPAPVLPGSPPSFSLSAASTTLAIGYDTTISWSSHGMSACALQSNGKTLSQALSGMHTTGILTENVAYELKCKRGANDTVESKSVAVTVLPTCLLAPLPDGTDQSEALHVWLVRAPKGATLCFPPNSTYNIKSRTYVSGHGGMTIEGRGATLQVIDPFSNGSVGGLLNFTKSSNITVRNLVIDGGVPSPTFSHDHENNTAIGLWGSRDVLIEKMTMRNLGGDCVLIISAIGEPDYWSEGVKVLDSTCTTTGRHGISLIAARNVRIASSTFDRIGYDVVDCEPDFVPEQGCQHITIEGNTAVNFSVLFPDRSKSIFFEAPGNIPGWPQPVVRNSDFLIKNNFIIDDVFNVHVQARPDVFWDNISIVGNTAHRGGKVYASNINNLTVSGNTPVLPVVKNEGTVFMYVDLDSLVAAPTTPVRIFWISQYMASCELRDDVGSILGTGIGTIDRSYGPFARTTTLTLTCREEVSGREQRTSKTITVQ